MSEEIDVRRVKVVVEAKSGASTGNAMCEAVAICVNEKVNVELLLGTERWEILFNDVIAAVKKVTGDR